VNSTILDTFAGVIQIGLPHCFRRNRNSVLLFCCLRLESWFDANFPILGHDLFDPFATQLVPLAAESILTHFPESFINEDASTQATWKDVVSTD
jgi:hypothetical protein